MKKKRRIAAKEAGTARALSLMDTLLAPFKPKPGDPGRLSGHAPRVNKYDGPHQSVKEKARRVKRQAIKDLFE